MEKRNRLSAKQITLGAAIAALTLLCLYGLSVIPWMHLALYFLASVFGYALLCDRRYGLAFLSYIGVSVLAFVLLPNKLPALVFAVLAGHFGIAYCYLQDKCKSRVLRVILLLLYCNVFTLLGGWLAVTVLGYAVEIGGMPSWLPGWGVVLAAELLFIAWQWLYAFAAQIYNRRIRPAVGK